MHPAIKHVHPWPRATSGKNQTHVQESGHGKLSCVLESIPPPLEDWVPRGIQVSNDPAPDVLTSLFNTMASATNPNCRNSSKSYINGH